MWQYSNSNSQNLKGAALVSYSRDWVVAWRSWWRCKAGHWRSHAHAWSAHWCSHRSWRSRSRHSLSHHPWWNLLHATLLWREHSHRLSAAHWGRHSSTAHIWWSVSTDAISKHTRKKLEMSQADELTYEVGR